MTLGGCIMRALAVCQGYISRIEDMTILFSKLVLRVLLENTCRLTSFWLGRSPLNLFSIFILEQRCTMLQHNSRSEKKNIILWFASRFWEPNFIFRFGPVATACSAWHENSIKVSIHSRLLFREARDCALSAESWFDRFTRRGGPGDAKLKSRRLRGTVHSINLGAILG